MRLTDLIAARSQALRTLRTRPLVACIESLGPRERVPGILMLSGRLPCGPIGISVRRLQEHVRRQALHGEGPGLSVLHATEGLLAIRGRRGMGAEKRLEHATTLFRATTRDEGDFLIRLMGKQLRAANVDRLIVQSIATSGGLDPALVWEAVQCSHDLGATARAAFGGGEGGLRALVAETKPGTRRDAELEAMVLEAPDDPEIAAVYADWLLEHGQPHGPLVAAAVVPSRAEQRKRAWSKALKQFVRSEGLGPELLDRLGDASVAEWHNGFLRRLWLPGQTIFAPDLAEAVLRLLESSASTCLEILGLDVDQVVPPSRIPALPLLAMLRLDLHPTLERLDLTELRIHPRLRHLQLEGSLALRRRDLSGVHQLRLERLDLKGTYDLAPLVGSSLETVVLSSANHVDPSPLARLPRLRVLGWGQRRSPPVRFVASLPHLRVLHLRERPSAELAAWARRLDVEILRFSALFDSP